jgi:putative hemolysin
MLRVSAAADLLAGIFWLLLSGLFQTLLLAYRHTDDAGIDRLADRLPHLADRLDAWAEKWGLLVSAHVLLAAASALASMAFLVRALLLPSLAGWVSAAAWAGLLAAALFVLSILPRAIAESYADRISLGFLPASIALVRFFYPLVWLLSALERALRRPLMRMTGETDRPSSEDEIMSLVEHEESRDLEEHEREIIRSVFEFGETVVREIMTPRVNVVGLEDEWDIRRCVEKIKDTRYSRFPVFHENLDDVRGLVHVKDLLRSLSDGTGDQPIGGIVKEAAFVPESMPIHDLLTELRSAQNHAAIVVDEYGGTAGLVSMEDIIEELLGEIQDEYDAEEAAVHRLADGSFTVAARTPVFEASERTGIELPESDEYDSVGGYIIHEFGRIPKPGETLERERFEMTVQNASARQIQTVRIQPRDPLPAEK